MFNICARKWVVSQLLYLGYKKFYCPRCRHPNGCNDAKFELLACRDEDGILKVQICGCDQVCYCYKEPNCIMGGKHSAVIQQKLVHRFVRKYVLCRVCENPETTLIVRGDTIYMLCKACHADIKIVDVYPGKQNFDIFIVNDDNTKETEINNADEKTRMITFAKYVQLLDCDMHLYAESVRLGVSEKAPLIIVQMLFDGTFDDTIDALLGLFVHNKKAQLYMMRGLASVIAKKRLDVTAVLGHFVEQKLLTREDIVRWLYTWPNKIRKLDNDGNLLNSALSFINMKK